MPSYEGVEGRLPPPRIVISELTLSGLSEGANHTRWSATAKGRLKLSRLFESDDEPSMPCC
eukprot:3712621-Amphidinium_carterae.1